MISSPKKSIPITHFNWEAKFRVFFAFLETFYPQQENKYLFLTDLSVSFFRANEVFSLWRKKREVALGPAGLGGGGCGRCAKGRRAVPAGGREKGARIPGRRPAIPPAGWGGGVQPRVAGS